MSAQISDLNLFDLEYALPAIPCFAHPLMGGSGQFNFKPHNNCGDEAAKSTEEEGPTSKTATASVNSEGFVDPLGAAYYEADTEQLIEATLKKETKLSQRHSINSPTTETHHHNSVAILTADRLDNTLVELNAEPQWPLQGLDPELVGFRPWHVLRQRILDAFSSSADRLSLESNFLVQKMSEPAEKMRNGIGKQANKRNAMLLKEKRRYITQDQPEPIIKFYELSQEEWVRKLTELRRVLVAKWREEQRLDCIKLMAEVTSLITTSITSAQFYPAQFVHVTDLLDLFGHLVHQRLLGRAKEERREAGLRPLPAHFDIQDVLEQTRLKARNWFGKVNEMVKNLAPRIYLLAALLPCQRFMDPPAAMQENVLELCRAVKQVQHPLISSYLRCYLCRMAMRLNAADRAPHWKCLNDWLQTYTQQPTSLLWPAMEWLVQCVSANAVSYADLHPLWEYCRLLERRPVVLIPMLNALPALYLGEHALEACRIVCSAEIVTAEELCALGEALLRAEVPQQARKPLLKAVWKCVMRQASLKHFMACCECWIEFVARHFSAVEVNVVLESVLRRVQQDKYELYIGLLLSCLQKVFTHSHSVSALFAMDIFPKFMDVFRSGPLREESARLVLGAIASKHILGTFSDVDLAYQVLSICQRLHDAMELSASDTQISSTTNLICSALDRVDLEGTDPEQCLQFLVDCRADLANLDGAQHYVCRRVQAFTLRIVREVRYSSSRAAFLQACLANLFISIPSLVSALDRITLSIQSAQIALAAMSFLQIDPFIEFALQTLEELSPADSATGFFSLGVQLLATLAQLPPEQQQDGADVPLRSFRRFLHLIVKSEWPSGARLERVRLLIRCMQHLFVVWPSGTTDNSTAESGVDGRSSVAHLVGGGEWSLPDVDELASENGAEWRAQCLSSCGECAELIAEQLSAELLEEGVTDSMCTLGVEMLELVAQFGPTSAEAAESSRGTGLPRSVRALAKAVYKRCKRRPALAARIGRLN